MSLSQSPRSCSSPSAPICRRRRRLVAASLKVALPQHFAATRGLFRPDASANFGSVNERCESTHDCFCHARNAPADILQKVSQMNLGIQPRYCDTSTGKNLQRRKRQWPTRRRRAAHLSMILCAQALLSTRKGGYKGAERVSGGESMKSGGGGAFCDVREQ